MIQCMSFACYMITHTLVGARCKLCANHCQGGGLRLGSLQALQMWQYFFFWNVEVELQCNQCLQFKLDQFFNRNSKSVINFLQEMQNVLIREPHTYVYGRNSPCTGGGGGVECVEWSMIGGPIVMYDKIIL